MAVGEKEDLGSEAEGLSFLEEEDEDGDSMFSLSGASSFDMSDSDGNAPPANATKFRF